MQLDAVIRRGLVTADFSSEVSSNCGVVAQGMSQKAQPVIHAHSDNLLHLQKNSIDDSCYMRRHFISFKA